MACAIPSNALLALFSATSWGGGDFSGGMGVKASGGQAPQAVRFVLLAHLLSLVALVSMALCWTGIASRKDTHQAQDSSVHYQADRAQAADHPWRPVQRSRIWRASRRGMPAGPDKKQIFPRSLSALTPQFGSAPGSLGQAAAALWAIVAGLTGALGVVTFYIALSRGSMGIPAALSGLLAAGIPALASSRMEGAPSHLRLAGFALAGGAIWLIAAENSSQRDGSRGSLAPALFSGVMFGVYFIALKMANPLGLIASMAIARFASVTLCLLVLVALAAARRCVPALRPTRQPAPELSIHRPAVWGWAGAVALLDTGGNLLFMAATRMGRLDVASVLASLYPAGTILLAAWVLHERPTQRQVVGMMAALAAVILITLPA
jgi:drug/metabolite transporter (DMT)-like permease